MYPRDDDNAIATGMARYEPGWHPRRQGPLRADLWWHPYVTNCFYYVVVLRRKGQTEIKTCLVRVLVDPRCHAHVL